MAAIYPEGGTQMNVHVPEPVKYGLAVSAAQRRLSRSQLVTTILEDWLKARGEMPKPEEVPA